MIGRDPYVM